MKVTGLLTTTLAVVLVPVLFFAGGCGRGKPAVNVVGSTSIQPFAELLAQEYAAKTPGEKVNIQGGGSTAGLQAVANGLADVGTCSRSLNPDEDKQFTAIIIARDGLAIVVNNANPVAGLTIDQIRGLFTGETKNWSQVGGKDEAVRLITREEGSGTRESFVNLVMAGQSISREALAQESNGAVKELVKSDSLAVGYMSLGLVGSELKALPIGGVAPTHDNVLNGTYNLSRPFLFVTKGPAGPAAQKFIDFVLSPEGQKALEKEGLVRAK
jgi:phosphate transport system substrate-binding protein